MSDFFKRMISAISSFFMTIAAFFGFAAKEPVSPYGKWQLSVPAFEAGTYCETVYNTGTGMENEVLSAAQAPSRMQLVKETTLQDAETYGKKLQSAGYRSTFADKFAKLHFYGYEKGTSRVYYYFDATTGVTRVIDDCCNTVSLDAFSYDKNTPAEPVTEPPAVTEPYVTEPIDPQDTQVNEDNAPPAVTQPGTTTTTLAPPVTAPYVPPSNFQAKPGVYQFSFPYYDSSHAQEKVYAKNGMLYVLVLSDGKLVIIDGGSAYQCADQNVEAFMRFVRELTGKSENEKMDIALWYGTHCHADHIDFFYKVIHKYRKYFNLERVMFNYQSNTVISYAKRVDKLRNLLLKYYPNVKYVKCRSGYRFSFLDTKFVILSTHEDLVSPETGTLPVASANECCSILKVTLGGKTFLFLGDASTATQTELLRKFTKTQLHVDVLQASHHMINNLTELYPVINPTYVMCPQSKSRTIEVYPSYYTFLKLASAQRMYFADQGVYGFLPQAGGSISITYRWVYCVGYDNSGL